LSNTIGGSNTASGTRALLSNTIGSSNTASGGSALDSNTTGTYNTAAGSGAGGSSDSITAYGGGAIALVPSTTGWYNTFLGRRAGATTQVSNCTAVGVDAYCTGDNQVRLGNAFVTSIGGKVAWSALSDLRAKTDLREVPLGLDFVLGLRPVAYRLRDGNGRLDMGFVAQDVEAVLGDGYNVLDVGGDENRTLSLRYTDLIAPLVKAVQEQQNQIRRQQGQMEAQRAEIESLTAALAELKGLKAAVAELKKQVRRDPK
jgi:hypothetical protein